MTNLELKKIEKRQKLGFIVLLTLIFLGAVLFINTNIYISIGCLIVAAIVAYIENLNKKMIKELEK